MLLLFVYEKILNTNNKFKVFNDWLNEYKVRYYIKKHICYNELNQINKTQLKFDLKKIRSEIKNWLSFDFSLNDVYNMNETSWFWKTMFDKIISNASTEGIKIDKIKIIATLCTNVFDQHKLKL